jgi:Holliday junction DNA helicase RuvA
MIAYLEGSLLLRGATSAIVNVGGVGYDVLASQRTLAALPAEGERVAFWVHTQVSDDAIQLIGFGALVERSVFLELTQITGIGPKLALNILSQLETPALVSAIRGRDLRALTSLSGVGKKTAERILVELAEKPSFALLGLTDPGAQPSVSADNALLGQLRLALENLGYRKKEIDPVLARLKPEADSLASIEAAVLRALGMIGG